MVLWMVSTNNYYSYREVVEDECDQYHQDIAFLQSCLYGEHDFITATLEEDMKPQPTLQGKSLKHFFLLQII